jgi:hypothetical protein
MRSVGTALSGLALAFLLVGAAFVVLPIPTGLSAEDSLPQLPPFGDSTLRGHREAVDSLAVEIVMENVFSSTRSAPLRRYMPPELAGDTSAGMLPDPSVNDSAALSAGFMPQLFGTIVGDQGSGASRALLQLDALDPVPRLYKEGERAGGYRVVSIGHREVVLTGPAGRTVLRLPE